MRSRMARCSFWIASSFVVLIFTACSAQTHSESPAQIAAGPEYKTVFYNNGSLRIEAYFYKPAGSGPYPLVVYNHGSRQGEERVEWPVLFIARMLIPAGYAVLVPERRGYGKSDGPTFSEEIGADRGDRYVNRLQQEADDALATLNYAKENLPIDPKRIALMGFSFGGAITTLAAGRSSAFVAVISQAPGALNWNKSPQLRQALTKAAETIQTPMLCMAAENDATAENVRTISNTVKSHHGSAEVIVYPPFSHPNNPNKDAPGHALFSPLGADLWKNDVLTFLAKYLR